MHQKQIKSVSVVLRPSTPEVKNIYLDIKNTLEKNGIEVMIDSLSAGMIGVLGYDFETMCKKADFLISIGGDGTLISTARRSFAYDRPILGINVGKLGFLTDILPNEFEEFLQNILKGDFRIDERIMIEANLQSNNNSKQLIAFNDVVFTRKNISQTIELEAKIDGKLFNTYNGDGVIISTPTGSTAYNLSAGGPVVYPLTEAFIINPIAAHSLTQRPLVLPSTFEIEISTIDTAGALIIVDGQEVYEFGYQDKITVKTSAKKARLIHHNHRNYFSILQNKLHWGKQ